MMNLRGERSNRKSRGHHRALALSALRFPGTVAMAQIAPAAQIRKTPMTRSIRVQGDSNAHDRPWRVAVEQGFFADEGFDVVYHEDNPRGAEGRVKDFAQR